MVMTDPLATLSLALPFGILLSVSNRRDAPASPEFRIRSRARSSAPEEKVDTNMV